MENAVPWEAPRRIHHRKETLLTEFGSDVIKTFMSKERKKGTIANTTPQKNLSDWFLIKEKIEKFISIQGVTAKSAHLYYVAMLQMCTLRCYTLYIN